MKPPKIIDSWNAYHACLPDIQQCPLIGLDLETTGLCPLRDTIRLVTLSDSENTWVLDTSLFSPIPLFPVLQAKTLLLHNAIFDLRFLARIGFWPGRVFDTMLMSQVLYAGFRGEDNKPLSHSLQAVAARELNINIDKGLQTSNWGGKLTQEQIEYAARDAQILIPIYHSLIQKIEQYRLQTALDIEHRCLPAVLWMSHMGIPFNKQKWEAVADREQERANSLEIELNELAGQNINWNSWQQVLKVFEAHGHILPNTNFETLSFVDHPIAQKLVERREAVKRVGSYGRNWLEFYHDGRIYTSWRQIGAATGRMASNDPAIQTVPHLEGEPYRSCIEAPEGQCLVIADYSTIELRIAAKIANETKMIEAFNKGQDLHRLTAQEVLGVSEVTKADRQLAKAVGFGFLYGMGAPKFQRYARLQFGVELTEEQAQEYAKKYATAYPAIKRWHRTAGNDPQTIRTLAGRWRIGIANYSEKLNSPVQGTGADGLKLAAALLYERRAECPNSYPIILCHDEIVVVSRTDEAEKAAAWVKQAMLDGMNWMLSPIPVDVEVKIGQTWGAK